MPLFSSWLCSSTFDCKEMPCTLLSQREAVCCALFHLVEASSGEPGLLFAHFCLLVRMRPVSTSHCCVHRGTSCSPCMPCSMHSVYTAVQLSSFQGTCWSANKGSSGTKKNALAALCCFLCTAHLHLCWLRVIDVASFVLDVGCEPCRVFVSITCSDFKDRINSRQVVVVIAVACNCPFLAAVV